MIHGVLVCPLQQFPDERGKVMRMLRCDDPHFIRFGEIYFSIVYPGVVKGWHRHTDKTLNYACVHGMVKLVLYDGREKSPTYGQLQEIFIGDDNYVLVQVPHGVWNGIKGLSHDPAIVANCATLPYSPEGIVYMDPHDNHIPYDWEVQHR